jgi:hypothetical protein
MVRGMMIRKAMHNKNYWNKDLNKLNRKSQVWLSDYTLSLLVFIIAVLLSLKIIVNSFAPDTGFEELKDDASKISEMLLSEGYPPDWDNESVIRPGICSGERLNSTKVFNAMNLSYPVLKTCFQTPYEFLVIFVDSGNDMIEFNDLCVIGNPDITINKTLTDCHNPDFTSITYDNLVKITRLAIHDTGSISMPVRMVVYVWQ